MLTLKTAYWALRIIILITKNTDTGGVEEAPVEEAGDAVVDFVSSLF